MLYNITFGDGPSSFLVEHYPCSKQTSNHLSVLNSQKYWTTGQVIVIGEICSQFVVLTTRLLNTKSKKQKQLLSSILSS